MMAVKEMARKVMTLGATGEKNPIAKIPQDFGKAARIFCISIAAVSGCSKVL
jgi:hypothetical protein